MSLERMGKFSWIYELHHIAQKAAQAGDTTGVHQQILHHIVAGLNAKSSSLAMLGSADGKLEIVAGIEVSPGVIGSKVALGVGVLGWIVQQDQPLLINGEVCSDPRVKVRRREGQSPAADNSSIYWPLKIEHRILGGISAIRPSGMPAFTAADLAQGTMLLKMVSLALGNIQLQIEQKQHVESLQQANPQQGAAHAQWMQSVKMASIGQLAAGVAHEINNPIGYVNSNLGAMEKYVQDMLSMMDVYEQAEDAIADVAVRARIGDAKKKLDIAFLKQDLLELMKESKEGITRVKIIVQNLKEFSHVDANDVWDYADLHAGIDSTLNIVNNEIKYKCELIKQYGTLPKVQCLPSQLNQVFMNLLVNAAHAIEESGTITVSSGQKGDEVWVQVTDTGNGIAAENLQKIFDPFFTTKPIGQGTGLGLSLSYGIIQKHHGRIEVSSVVGKGSTFRVWLPLKHV